MYTIDDPKWVQASSVAYTKNGYATVVAYGETFDMCEVQWSDPTLNKDKSDVLVQNSQGDWLRVWFFDKDVVIG